MRRTITIIFLGVAWAAFAAIMLRTVGRDLALQVASVSYDPIDAIILESQVQQLGGSRGRISYGWRVRYRYSADGRDYESTQQKYTGDLTSGDAAEAASWITAAPPSSVRPAYVDPEDPSDAVLRVGAGASDFLPLAVLFAALTAGGALLLAGAAKPDPADHRVTEEAARLGEESGRVGASVSALSPRVYGGLAAVAAAFGGTLANGALAGRSPLMVVIGQIAVVAVAAEAGARVKRLVARMRLRPNAVVLFDRSAGVVSFPELDGWGRTRVIALRDVVSFRVVEVEHECRMRNRFTGWRLKKWIEVEPRVAAEVLGADGEARLCFIARSGTRAEAQALASWCGARLVESGVEPSPPAGEEGSNPDSRPEYPADDSTRESGARNR